MNYYNENDPQAAAWLRGLIATGLIPMGRVDERSIADVQPGDLRGYTQCHFFAGIAGWALALELAGWPEDRPVWTGSCPCQPYSGAGKGLGDADPRNLWPQMFRLIRECRPSVVFGEQVASAIRHGWLDGICADLEGANYAVGAHVLGAHSAGAPHIRQRLFWVGNSTRDNERGNCVSGEHWQGKPIGGSSHVCRLDSGQCERCAARGHRDNGGHDRQQSDTAIAARRLGKSDSSGRTSGKPSAESARYGNPVESAGDNSRMGDSHRAGLSEQCGTESVCEKQSAAELRSHVVGMANSSSFGSEAGLSGQDQREEGQPGVSYNRGSECAWTDSQWHQCRDGKARRIPTEPALFPLADGLPYRVGKRGSIRPALLKGAGNAIVPQVAAEFIKAFMIL